MVRFSTLHPVHRIKHIVDAEGGLVAGTASLTPLITAVDAPTLSGVNEVVTGSKVSSIYLHVEVSHTSGTGRPNIYMAIMKNPGAAISTGSAINSLGDSDTKRFFIHQEMIMMSGDAGNGLPRPLFNGVIRIPRGYQRFGPDDDLQCIILSPNVAAEFCLQAHYKEFR